VFAAVFQLVMKIGPHGMAGEMGVILGVPQPFSVRSRRLTQALCISNSHLLGILRSNTADANTVCANFVKQLKSLKELQVAEDAPFFEETFSKTNMVSTSTVGLQKNRNLQCEL
jgi:potassium channel